MNYEGKGSAKGVEGYIPVTGGKIWYKIVGANRKKIPLLVLHGGPGAPHDYLEPLEALSDERPVIFYDQLGCGNSDKPSDKFLWTVERFVSELEQVRSYLGLDKMHLLGQSWGTMLAVDFILVKKPKGVMSLILSGPCLSSSRFASDQKLYLLELSDALQKTINESEMSGCFDSKEYQDAMMVYYKIHVCRLDPWPDCLNRTLEKLGHEVYEQMWGPSEFTLTGCLKNYERVDLLKEISVPTLFTCGCYDEATPSSTAYYHSMLPGSEIVIFEGASHEHHLEKIGEYLEVVRNFINKIENR
ncbi:proline iminopeptidase-family hydrolase [Methanosarcina sp. UBA411]|jgi:proline iminopeptidase|uniref:proline iminopeptidase-family hydrolase n=1 Tax=Methanosarcina sp. UBA411 TaxID=1915589 RepID=UPI002600909C|nr:proline iminopeptidase-family hydrolase [Methanosarcina sp. UBA411]